MADNVTSLQTGAADPQNPASGNIGSADAAEVTAMMATTSEAGGSDESLAAVAAAVACAVDEQDADKIQQAVDDLGIFDDKEETIKVNLINPTVEEMQVVVADLKTRMQDGCGECVYAITDDDGMTEEKMAQSVATLEKAANECDAEISCLRVVKDDKHNTADYLVRKRHDDDDFIEVRIAVVGNVDAGKSTLLGVLTHGALDDGRGKCRRMVFRHKHEVDTGRTSSIAHDILGFDGKGNVVNKPAHDMSLDWPDICMRSSKVLTFIDLAGHEKYLKTTVFGFTGHAPHFAMLMVGANMGIVGMTKEHLRLTLVLNVPVFIVITKIDMCPDDVLQENLKILTKILKSPGCRKVPMVVSNEDDAVVCAMNFVSERICPIFLVSNVTGLNLNLLRKFLNLLNARQQPNLEKPAEFQIDETYSVDGVGTVVSGTVMCGRIHVNDTLVIGPDSLGNFQNVAIKGVHRRRMPTSEARGGQTASLALKKFKRSDIRKGMVLLSPLIQPRAVWEFEAEIRVLHHATTIGRRYQAMVHCGSVRQTAFIKEMAEEHVRTGDKTTAVFQFIKSPEYLRVGTPLVFREGQTKAVGVLTRLIFEEKTEPAKTKRK